MGPVEITGLVLALALIVGGPFVGPYINKKFFKKG